MILGIFIPWKFGQHAELSSIKQFSILWVPELVNTVISALRTFELMATGFVTDSILHIGISFL